MNLFSGLSLIAASAVLSTTASATVISLGEFNTDGDQESFTAGNIQAGSLTVAGGFLSANASTTGGLASTDPQLNRNFSTSGGAIVPPAGETFSTIEFRVREFNPDGGVIEIFNSSGLFFGTRAAGGGPLTNIAEGNDFTAGEIDSEGFFLVSADISVLGSTPIQNVRVDPVGGAGTVNNSFDVDFIRVTTVPEPSALALVGLGGASLLLRRRGR